MAIGSFYLNVVLDVWVDVLSGLVVQTAFNSVCLLFINLKHIQSGIIPQVFPVPVQLYTLFTELQVFIMGIDIITSIMKHVITWRGLKPIAKEILIIWTEICLNSVYLHHTSHLLALGVFWGTYHDIIPLLISLLQILGVIYLILVHKLLLLCLIETYLLSKRSLYIKVLAIWLRKITS